MSASKRSRPGDYEQSSEYLKKSRRQDVTAVGTLSMNNLLDFSALTSHSEINIRFGQLADALLCGHYLSLEHEDVEHKFDILELECYLYKSGCHEDPFTHVAEEQRYGGRWCAYTIFFI